LKFRLFSSVLILISSLLSVAQASEYGCQVLLCLATPGNPKKYAECVPPITRLFRDLARGRAFPTCDLADGSDGKNYAKQVYDPYDPCPAGTQPAQANQYVVQGKAAKKNVWRNTFSIQGTPKVSQPALFEGFSLGARACVANAVGQYAINNNDNYSSVFVYETVFWQAPQNPRAIDVYMDNQFYQRVRW
jgi:hypothetical protein